jgi:hypothetical protein
MVSAVPDDKVAKRVTNHSEQRGEAIWSQGPKKLVSRL